MYVCRPLLHALISPGVKSGFGIEIDQIKCSKAHAFLRQSAAALMSRGLAGKDLTVPVVHCSAIEKVGPSHTTYFVLPVQMVFLNALTIITVVKKRLSLWACAT